MRFWILSSKLPTLSVWGSDCTCGVLVCWTSGMTREVGVVCTCVSDSGADGVTGEMCALFGVLEEWLLLACRVNMEIGCERVIIFPSEEGLIPSWIMNFMMRLQNGIHPRAVDRATVFLMVWKMWAQISMGASVIRSQRNWAIPRLMKVMLDSG